MHGDAVLHLALDIAAFLAGGLLYWRSANASTQPPARSDRWALLAGAALGAALGSRCLYVLQYWHALSAQPLGQWLGGKTLVGGLLGALCGVEAAKRTIRFPHSTGDGFVAPLLAAIAIGRVGCQLSGLGDLTYGNPTSLPWGWNYGDGIARHPTALYEIAGLGALALLVRAPLLARVRGDRFRAFLTGYLLLRLALDYLKPPFAAPAAGMLAPERWALWTPIQWACVLGIVYYARDLRRWLLPGVRAVG
jgi:phosphatidylglycerol---prolipoprotein diacylglyceryl transferase